MLAEQVGSCSMQGT